MRATAFSADGQSILTATPAGHAQIHTWPGFIYVAPEWLATLAEAVGGFRLRENGISEHLHDSALEIVRLREKFESAELSDPLTAWGKWYLADRGTRTINPLSNLTVREYAKLLAAQEPVLALEEALMLNPNSPDIYRELAQDMGASRPKTAALYRKIAAALSK